MAPADPFDNFLRAKRRRAEEEINVKFKTLKALAKGVNSTL